MYLCSAMLRQSVAVFFNWHHEDCTFVMSGTDVLDAGPPTRA